MDSDASLTRKGLLKAAAVLAWANFVNVHRAGAGELRQAQGRRYAVALCGARLALRLAR
jgi:hypothetical protein